MALIGTAWLPKVTPYLERFGSVDYVLTEQELSLAEVNDPFILQFLGEMDSALNPYKVPS